MSEKEAAKSGCRKTGSMPPPESLFFLLLLLSTSPLLCHSTSAYFLQIHFLIGAAARRCCCAQKRRGLRRAAHTHRNGGSRVETESVRFQLLRSKGQTRHCPYVNQLRLSFQSREFRPFFFVLHRKSSPARANPVRGALSALSVFGSSNCSFSLGSGSGVLTRWDLA